MTPFADPGKRREYQRQLMRIRRRSGLADDRRTALYCDNPHGVPIRYRPNRGNRGGRASKLGTTTPFTGSALPRSILPEFLERTARDPKVSDELRLAVSRIAKHPEAIYKRISDAERRARKRQREARRAAGLTPVPFVPNEGNAPREDIRIRRGEINVAHPGWGVDHLQRMRNAYAGRSAPAAANAVLKLLHPKTGDERK